ncbi:MAG: S41 family peptidase [Chloroflexota bacterium]
MNPLDPTAPDSAWPETSVEPATDAPAPIIPVGSPPRRGRFVFGAAIVLVAVLAGSALFLSGYSVGRRTAEQPGTPAALETEFQPFWDAYQAVTERYAGGEIDRKALIEGAIKGMIEAIGDPYSSYLTSQEYRDSLQGISGQFEGIGAEIGTRAGDGSPTDCSTLGPDCRLVIIAPIDGSPALKAGLRAGDLVLAVDGSTLDGLSIDEARDRIRGKKGTTVILTVVRDGGPPTDISIVRDVITQREVISEELADGTIGYVRLTGFSDAGAKAFVEAVQAHVDAGRSRLIVDLRGNPGGFVTAARTVASTFIATGPVFWEEDSKGKQTPTTAEEGGVATDASIEIIVLIDRGSASASEIVAGALQDTGRARLVGETSFGKGTVQQWTPLENDNGGFRLTVARWLTPDKRWIHHIGLEPDVPVEVPTDVPAGSDPVLDRAVELLTGTAAQPLLLQRAA